MNKQFVQVPKLNLKELGLEIKDLVIYAYLKKHYNHQTKEAFPSFDTLVKESGISKPTIIKCVNRLEAAGYIKVSKQQKVNHYTFSDINKFEIYSFDFLEDPNLSLPDKAYIIGMQPHMIKDPDLGIGKVTYSDLDIARMLNIDIRTLRKYESHLKEGEKPVMTMIPTHKKDPITGLTIQERIFDFECYHNKLALKVQSIEKELENKVSIEDYNKLLARVRELEKQQNTVEVKPIEL